MLRVLQCVNNMQRAGLETMLMNYYRNIDRTRVQFDFLMHREESSAYDDEIEALGGKIYRAPRLFPKNYPSYFQYMKNLFKEHPEYRIVHSHIDSMSYLPLLAAKKAAIPVRIAHSHNTGIDLDYKYLLKQLYRYSINNVTTHSFACGTKAGEFLFRGGEFTVVPNAIEPSVFRYDETERKNKRNELNIKNELVIGHIGRMTYQKNQSFLLKVFSKILEQRPNSVLLLIGNGEKEQELKQKAEKLKINSKVRFLGERNDVSELYKAMDVLVLPSRFEGVPLVGIEAQFSGLPCVFSNGVPKETAFSENCRFKDLSDPISSWAHETITIAEITNRAFEIDSCKYDIKKAASVLQNQYETLALD